MDEINHFEVRVPEGWYPIRRTRVDSATRQMQEATANKGSRYVGGYTRSRNGKMTLPHVLFQIEDGDMNRLSEAGLIRLLNAQPLGRGASDTLSEVLTSRASGVAWDPVERRTIIPMETDVPGVGSVRGIFVGRIGSHGIVQINCYARASEFDATMPAFREWIDGVKIDADYEWEPGSEVSNRLRRAGRTALIAAIAALLASLIYERLRRSRA